MLRRLALPLTIAAACTATAAPAHADTLLTAVSGGQHLTSGGGYAAWSTPAGNSRFKLVVRTPSGRVEDAPIPTFGAPVDAAIGSTRTAFPRSLVAVYSRCEGRSATRGCDVHQYDLRARTERRVPRLATAGVSETAPSISSGSYAFVRRDGARPGTYVLPEGGTADRLDRRLAQETAVTESRAVFLLPGDRILWRALFAGRVRTIGRAPAGRAFSLVATRYRIGWLERGGDRVTARLSDRIESGTATIRTGRRTLPASTTSVSVNASNVDRYLDATGLHAVTPNLFPSN